MPATLCDKLIELLTRASQHNSQVMVRPEVILWPDPEWQWAAVIPVLQAKLPALLVWGPYQPALRQGPAIWLKCMVVQTLPEADWPAGVTPIIYLPGVSKSDLKNITGANADLQPLLEYQYTGTMFTQTSGREWTVPALLENQSVGLGLRVAQDHSTKEAVIKALAILFQHPDLPATNRVVDTNFLHELLFPNIVPGILQWLCQGDHYTQSLPPARAEVFAGICRSRYGFEPDVKNVRAIAGLLGAQRNNWQPVWQHYIHAPHKYPEIAGLLRLAKPAELGTGMFAAPEESWPQVNEEKEAALRAGLAEAATLNSGDGLKKLTALEQLHGGRRKWVWADLGQAPLAHATLYLLSMAEICTTAFPAASIQEMQAYYRASGYKADQAMRQALAAVKTEQDKSLVTQIIRTIYQPWLENSTRKFQALVAKDPALFSDQAFAVGPEEFVLFVDALRYELGMEFFDRLGHAGYKTGLSAGWSAIPSLTPTAKPAISPLSGTVSPSSAFNEFRPQLQTGKDLLTAAFRSALVAAGWICVTTAADIQPGHRHWQEIGDIDTKGHNEQAGIVRRIDELFGQVLEAISGAFEKGITSIRIVTDHGWLLLPGGLPKQELNRDLVETRWGRCALIKDGAHTNLLHLPWRWNPAIFIAYAPGISFFKKNEEYAHGGISIQECLVPTLTVENNRAATSLAKLKEPKWINLRCKIETMYAPDGYLADIRTKYDAPDTSIVLSGRKSLQDNKVTLMVDDEAFAKSATVVLMDPQGVIFDKKPTLVGG